MTASRLVPLALAASLLAGCDPAIRWRTVTSAPGRFSVRMPGAPTEERLAVPTPSGTLQKVSMVVVRGGITYRASYTDSRVDLSKLSPPAWRRAATRILEAARDGTLREVHGTLREDRAIDLDGYPGRIFTIDVPGSGFSAGMVQRNKFFYVNQRYYNVVAVAPRSKAGSPDIDRFLSSFRLLAK